MNLQKQWEKVRKIVFLSSFYCEYICDTISSLFIYIKVQFYLYAIVSLNEAFTHSTVKQLAWAESHAQGQKGICIGEGGISPGWLLS